MAKLKNPLASLRASGGLGNALSFARRRMVDLVMKKPVPLDARSEAQLSWRHMFNKCVDLWHLLSAAEKSEWESAARSRHMTGYAWYMSQCLRPNPGIYLPLQGGKMSGNIDMDQNRVLKLLPPVYVDEPARKYDLDALEARYQIGARAWHNATQAIPHLTFTTVALNSEIWDTDNIHDPVTNNSRLTCQTAGIYIIVAQVRFQKNAVGFRQIKIRKNASADIAIVTQPPPADTVHILATSTIWALMLTEFVEIIVKQTSGGPLNLDTATSYSPHFMMERIG